MSFDQPTIPVLAAALLLVLAGTGAVAGTALIQGDPPEPTTEKRPPSDGANFTVAPEDHSPGAGTPYIMLSKGEGPWGDSEGLETIDYYKITTQETQFESCTPNDAKAFGIDRKNDAGGTKTDTALLSHMRSYSVEGRIITVEIYDEGDLGGSPTYLNRSDETVAKLANCVTAPSEKGWYQFTGYVNGTNYDGEFQEVTLYSKYYYICDCEDREAAKQTLGPPPHSGGGSTATPTPTATPGDTATPTPEATTTPAPDSTATPSPTATPGQSSNTPTSQSNTNRDDPATATPTGTAAGSGGSDGTEATATSAGNPQRTVDTSTPTTPTLAEGPGFGALAALVGVLVVGLLARRR
ncbi:PGF-CTERM sorting domain-containing protein [Halorarius halobius]|uniref:PGF-CTERM sorting domain-containing protein n=1 Tax=Halorarius halobius TaxID=2962671 RepID=UPI0025750A88|nr:PGF-CTERM sorting domain-containing protein [Halorarius halobius]